MRAAPLFTLLLAAAAAACGRTEPGETATNPVVDSAIAALTGDEVRDTVLQPGDTAYFRVARIIDRQGRELGTLRLVDHPGTIAVTGQLSGLPPGARGFHIHEHGVCDPPGFEGAGDHWAPQGREHGLRNPRGPHMGDLPNLVVRESGIAEVNHNNLAGHLRGDGDPMSALGRTLVIHAEEDDQVTDPSGNSGDRIACGVITRG
jgi:superoxide dismutase, Cu-Zn family